MGRRAVVLVIALVLAAASAFAVFQFLKGVEDEARRDQEMIPVFRATQTITEGTQGAQILQGGAGILYKESEEQFVDLPEGAIQTEEDLRNVLSGSVAVGPIPANGILVASQWVTPTVELTPLKDIIETGKQALTISPGDVQGVNGFAQPGDHVNVIVTVDIEFGLTAVGNQPSFGIPGDTGDGTEGETGGEGTVVVPYTRFVLQNLKVLAVGREVVPSDPDDQNVTAEGEITTEGQGQVQGEADAAQASTIYTLEVDPGQAERLVYAMQEGTIYLTLVPDGYEEVVTQGVTIDTLFEGNLIDDIFDN